MVDWLWNTQVIYSLDAIIVCDSFPLSITAALSLNNSDSSESGTHHQLSWIQR